MFDVLEGSSEFTPGDQAEARRLTGMFGDPCVLWTSRLDANKDPLMMLDAVEQAIPQLPDLRLWCCFGQAPLLREVRARVATSDVLRDRVVLLGARPHDEVERLFRAADFYVQTSHREGSGYSLLEAMSCGTPPIVTDIPATRRIVGDAGSLTPVGDASRDVGGARRVCASRPRGAARRGACALRERADVRRDRPPASRRVRGAHGIMRVLILGGDGYLGWPTAMRLAARGDDVMVVDNYLHRRLARETASEALVPTPMLPDRAAIYCAATGRTIAVEIGDCTDEPFLTRVFREFQPDAVVHYAEQPSAPYSMMGYDAAQRTLTNNIGATFNVIWSVMRHAPSCHIVKLGTMGEYGTPNIDIEEGWIDIEHKGRRDRFLYPRQGGSLYHTTKILDTDLLWFYVRTHGLRVTDLMQGPVYGLSTAEADADKRLAPHFHYDDIFGTVLNRFLVQAVAGVPLTVHGAGGQTRGFLNIEDTLQCVELALRTSGDAGRDADLQPVHRTIQRARSRRARDRTSATGWDSTCAPRASRIREKNARSTTTIPRIRRCSISASSRTT